MTDAPTDDARIADALRFYLERVAWSPSDTEKIEYERLLMAFCARATSKESARRRFIASTGNILIEKQNTDPIWFGNR